MSHTVLEPEAITPGSALGRWMVMIYNNDHTPFDVVVAIIMRATGCDLQEAEIETWEAHTMGKAPVHFASENECHAAARIIESVGVKTEVAKEWDE
jgi:ATP-dependent Clp protease adapter protein ClpS